MASGTSHQPKRFSRKLSVFGIQLDPTNFRPNAPLTRPTVPDPKNGFKHGRVPFTPGEKARQDESAGERREVSLSVWLCVYLPTERRFRGEPCRPSPVQLVVIEVLFVLGEEEHVLVSAGRTILH